MLLSACSGLSIAKTGANKNTDLGSDGILTWLGLRDELFRNYHSEGTMERFAVCHWTVRDYLGIWRKMKVILG